MKKLAQYFEIGGTDTTYTLKKKVQNWIHTYSQKWIHVNLTSLKETGRNNVLPWPGSCGQLFTLGGGEGGADRNATDWGCSFFLLCANVHWTLPQHFGAVHLRPKCSPIHKSDSAATQRVVTVTSLQLSLGKAKAHTEYAILCFHRGPKQECVEEGNDWPAKKHPGSLTCFTSPPPPQRTGSQSSPTRLPVLPCAAHQGQQGIPSGTLWLGLRLRKLHVLAQCNIATCLIEWPSTLAF